MTPKGYCRTSHGVCKLWTAREDTLIRTHVQRRSKLSKVKWKKVLKLLKGRTRGAILMRASKIGVQARAPHWTTEEDRILVVHWGELTPRALQKHLPLRSWIGISKRAAELDLGGNIPQGWVTGAEACRRAGISKELLDKLAVWGNVTVKKYIGTGKQPAKRQHFWQIYEWDGVVEALERWLKTETTEAASVRIGITRDRLARMVIRELNNPYPGYYRAEPEWFDAVVAKSGWKPGCPRLTEHGVRLGISDGTLRSRLKVLGVTWPKGTYPSFTTAEMDALMEKWRVRNGGTDGTVSSEGSGCNGDPAGGGAGQEADR